MVKINFRKYFNKNNCHFTIDGEINPQDPSQPLTV